MVCRMTKKRGYLMPAKSNKKKTIRFTGLVKHIIFATNIIAILLLLSAFLSWKVSPLKTNLFSYIGLAYGAIILINILYLGLWILFNKWKLALISFMAIAICYKPITTFFPLNVSVKKAPDTAIKILTYNVQGFVNERSKKNGKFPLLDYIAKQDADIVCLQEYMVSKTGKSLISQRDVNKILKHYPYYSVTPLRSSTKSLTYGLACFSKYPIEATKNVGFKSSYNGAAIYTINIDSAKYAVANVHLESNSITAEDKELYTNFLQSSDGVNLENVTSNIRSKLGKAYRTRTSQVNKVKSELEEMNVEGVIICGDFNDTPISYTFSQMKLGLKDAFTTAGFGPGITYNEDLFWFRIDNIMYSPNMKAYKAKVDRVLYSDHYPLKAIISLNK